MSQLKIKSFVELGLKHRKLFTSEPRKTKHPFLCKGGTNYSKWSAFITGNGKLLIHADGSLHTFTFWEFHKWKGFVGGRNSDETVQNIARIWGRAAIVRGGKQALVNGGWLKKRLFLTGAGMHWKVIALASTYIPHIMDDAKNCPVIAREKIKTFLAWNGDMRRVNDVAKEYAWLGGIKVPFCPVGRPENLAFKPQHRRDIYYMRAMLATEFYSPVANRWLLANQHRRSEIPHIDKNFPMHVRDGFMLKEQLEQAGFQIPTIKKLDIVSWSKLIHEEWDKQQTEIALRRDAATNAMPLPGENLIPELEHLRIKTKGDLRRVGMECHHCVGSYANMSNMAHYRKDNVVCQVEWIVPGGWNYSAGREYVPYVNQCYDFANSTTEASEEFRREIEKHLSTLTSEHVKACMIEEQEYNLFDTPIALPRQQIAIEEFPF